MTCILLMIASGMLSSFVTVALLLGVFFCGDAKNPPAVLPGNANDPLPGDANG